MLEVTLEEAGLPKSGSVFKRSAARGIAFRDGKLLAIHTDAGDYKFPGGGAEAGESLEQALSREMLEETGYTLTGSAWLWAVAHERRKGKTADILEMDSYYFLCQVGAPRFHNSWVIMRPLNILHQCGFSWRKPFTPTKAWRTAHSPGSSGRL